MKSIVQAVLSSMSGIGAILGFALYPASRNPYLIIMYAALAAAVFVAGIAFWLMFRRFNKIDAQLDKRDKREDDASAGLDEKAPEG